MIDRLLRDRVLRNLDRLERASLTVVEPHGTVTAGQRGSDLHATIAVRSPRVYRRLAFGGGLGAAESYLRGEWMADDLVAALRVFARNIAIADRFEAGLGRLGGLSARLLHWRRKNTRTGSRRNIRDHYDLGNELFGLFLDPTLTYSCAYFEHERAGLEEASLAKLDRVCRKLALAPGQRVLEIGTGWGSFAIHAARHYGCHVTTTTISPAQHELAARRVAAAGVADRVRLLQSDYRELTGTFDRLVSIEMIEAVGHEYLDAYFRACADRLAPDGEMLLQAIVMADHRHEAYRRSPDYIQRYVFPGSALPSLSAIRGATARTTDLGVAEVEEMTGHYVMTLRRWRETFMARVGAVKALGYDDRFVRLWEYYLAYCEAGFTERHIGAVQMRLIKPHGRRTAAEPTGGRHERVPVRAC
jgi:cyclopropane-fatty-acyl-phospholipid synthase